jgi:threonine dehydratase
VPGAEAAQVLAARLAAGDADSARKRVRSLVRHTPLLTSRSLSERAGGEVQVKAENLQRTGSFKLRGAVHKLTQVPEARLVVAASAGNHAQSLAYAARERAVGCEVFMPCDAPVAKVAAVEAFGGRVTLSGESVDECVTAAKQRAAETGGVFVHPFDDPDVVLGQATLGLELLEDAPHLAQVVVPVGGGGLICGIAGAIKAQRPAVRVVGVQVEGCSPFARALRTGDAAAVPGPVTIADGIAIKHPGELTLPLARLLVDEMVTVDEDEVAEAMVWLMERTKLVVEGAGAVGVAALLGRRVATARAGPTIVVLSGGNVDPGLLATIVQRHEATAGRRLRLYTRIPDRPGALASLLAAVAEAGGNVVSADHVREAVALHVRETGVEIALETRGAVHGEAIVAALDRAGYPVQRLDPR